MQTGEKVVFASIATHAPLHALPRGQVAKPSLKQSVSIYTSSYSGLITSRAPWLSTTLKWFDEFCAEDFMGDLEQEATELVQRIQGLYMAAQAGVQQIHEVDLALSFQVHLLMNR